MWFRVDNRLVHGQVIEAWLPYTGARHLIVANDELAADALRQQIIELAVPQRILTIPIVFCFGIYLLHFIALYRLRVATTPVRMLGAAFAGLL